ncbi:MAG: hypothetical protein H8E61_05375 [Bacteroidetes bacterium]|nr:hypothetical protein [Bacteroidota bacterium]
MTEINKQKQFEALEKELLKKRSEMSELLEQVQDIPSQINEQLGKIEDFGELKKIGEAVVEMEKNVGEKRDNIQDKLQDIQTDLKELKKLGEKTTVEDIKTEMKALVKRLTDKKESLEKAINEVDTLRGHYSKLFLGK